MFRLAEVPIRHGGAAVTWSIVLIILGIVGGILSTIFSVHHHRSMWKLARREVVNAETMVELYRLDFFLLADILTLSGLVVAAWFTNEPSVLALSIAGFLWNAAIGLDANAAYERTRGRYLHRLAAQNRSENEVPS